MNTYGGITHRLDARTCDSEAEITLMISSTVMRMRARNKGEMRRVPVPALKI
jgi:hypothetical protein